MNKLALFKLVTNAVVGAGTATISNSIIKNNVQPENLIQQISTGLASAVIASMAVDKTKAHTDAQIDNFVAAWNKAQSKSETTTA